MISNCLNVEIIENGSILFLLYVLIKFTRIITVIDVTSISNFVEFSLPGNGEGDVLYAEEILQPHLKAFPKVSYSEELLLQKSKRTRKLFQSRLLLVLLILCPFLFLVSPFTPLLVSQL